MDGEESATRLGSQHPGRFFEDDLCVEKPVNWHSVTIELVAGIQYSVVGSYYSVYSTLPNTAYHLPVLFVFVSGQVAKQAVKNGKDQAKRECPPKAIHGKARDKIIDHQNYDRIDGQQEQS